MFGFRKRKSEQRVTQSASDFFRQLVGKAYVSDATNDVSHGAAMGVPAFGAAVAFLSNTIASLPLNLYRRATDSVEKESLNEKLAALVRNQVNDSLSSFKWRKIGVVHWIMYGRWLTYIERDATGKPINLFLLDPARVTIKTSETGAIYEYKAPDNKRWIYRDDEILDIVWDYSEDMVSSIGPYQKLRSALGQAISSRNYAASYFRNGGVPPGQLTGPFHTAEAMNRAGKEVEQAIKATMADNRSLLVLPPEHEIKAIGLSPEQGQLIDSQRFSIEEIARGFNLPPVFLQDLTKGTYSNTEQQDLHLVKHTLRGLLESIEAEINTKFFPRYSHEQFVEFNVDGLLRGDFKSRMEGYQKAVNAGIMTPDEARALENRANIEGGDRAYIQGAMVPLPDAGKHLDIKATQKGQSDGTQN